MGKAASVCSRMKAVRMYLTACSVAYGVSRFVAGKFSKETDVDPVVVQLLRRDSAGSNNSLALDTLLTLFQV